MSKDTLKKYVVTGRAATVSGGLVRLCAAQARPRLHNLKAVEVVEKGEIAGAGIYEVVRPVQFKQGEQFEHDGVFPKAMAEAVATPGATTASAPGRDSQRAAGGKRS